MQPFDDSLYSGYSSYNNWKVPSTPSSLAKASFAWGLTGSSFNMGSASAYGTNNTNYGSMYSSVVSTSSTSPTDTNSEASKTGADSSINQHQYPPMPKLKSSPHLLKEAGNSEESNAVDVESAAAAAAAAVAAGTSANNSAGTYNSLV